MKCFHLTALLVTVVCLATDWAYGETPSATLVDLPIDAQTPLVTALAAAGLTPVAGDPAAKSFSGNLVVWECKGATGLDARFVAENGTIHIAFPPVKVTDLRLRMPWINAMPDKSNRAEPQLGDTEILGRIGDLPPAIHGTAVLVLPFRKLNVSLLSCRSGWAFPSHFRRERWATASSAERKNLWFSRIGWKKGGSPNYGSRRTAPRRRRAA